MPACKRLNKAAKAFCCMALSIACVACGPSASGGAIELRSVNPQWQNGRLNLQVDQHIRLSEEARKALENGVALSFNLEIILRDASARTRLAEISQPFEIRYLPLSNRYQLIGADGTSSYPRLRHLLTALSRQQLTLETGVLPADEYELLARMKLDKRSMPPPMQLPVLFSPAWRHDSNWSSWPLNIQAET